MNGYKVVFLSLSKIRAHERIDNSNVLHLCKLISKMDIWTDPILVDDRDYIILDGHHRVAAALMLGLNKIPALLINYDSEDINVISWHEGRKISKEVVREAAFNELLPIKTSRHIIGFPIKSTSIKLSLLKKAD